MGHFAGEGECGGGVPGNPGRLLFWRGWRRCLENDGRRDVWKPIFDKEPVASIGALRWRRRSENITWDGCQHDFLPTATMEMEFTNPLMAERTAACGLEEHAAHREILNRSTESGRRAGCGDGSQFRTERRARRFSLDGWRADVEKSFVQRQCDGGDRPLVLSRATRSRSGVTIDALHAIRRTSRD